MRDDDDKFWKVAAAKLRRALKLNQLGAVESQQEYAAADEVDVPEDSLNAMVDSVVTGSDDWSGSTPEPEEDWSDDAGLTMFRDAALQLNRNPGEPDEVVDQRIDELRRKALDDNEQANKDKPGLETGEEPGQKRE